MQKTYILLKSISDIKDFVSLANNYDCDIDLVCGRYTVDAKSIMGIFSLDLSKPIELQIHTEECPEFLEKIERFIVNI